MSTVVTTSRGPGCLIQLLWFVFVGWWLGQAAAVVAYLCMLTVIGIPIGIVILHNLPRIVALRAEPESVLVTSTASGQTVAAGQGRAQFPFLVRALWFVLVGWWLTALWIEVAFALCATIIGLPVGFWMFDKTPAVLTLRQN
jgi:uncharacterized membrane protein YccF (DUF307 family)